MKHGGILKNTPKMRTGKKSPSGKERLVPQTVVISHLLLVGIERLWEAHDYLLDPRHFSLATKDTVL